MSRKIVETPVPRSGMPKKERSGLVNEANTAARQATQATGSMTPNPEEKKTRKKKKSKKADNNVVVYTQEERDQLYVKMRHMEASSRKEIAEIQKQFGCSRRQARKRRRLGKKKWSEANIAVAVEDDQTRSARIKHRASPARTRGPFKGPSKRPPGTSNSNWRDYMSGRRDTL